MKMRQEFLPPRCQFRWSLPDKQLTYRQPRAVRARRAAGPAKAVPGSTVPVPPPLVALKAEPPVAKFSVPLPLCALPLLVTDGYSWRNGYMDQWFDKYTKYTIGFPGPQKGSVQK